MGFCGNPVEFTTLTPKNRTGEKSYLAIKTITCSASFATVRENNAKAGPNAIKAQPKKTMRVISANLSDKGRIFYRGR